MKVDINVDTKDFDAAMKKYMEFTKKSIPEIVNTKALYVARAAVSLTATVDKTKIEAELKAQARNGKGPLAAIVVNAQRGRKGEKGLFGAKMAAAVNKLIRIRKRGANFLRAGWIPAIKALSPFVKQKGGAASIKGVKAFGAPKGGALVAKPSPIWSCKAEIWNSVSGGKDKQPSNAPRVTRLIVDGLQKAINKEKDSILAYIKKKTDEGLKKLQTR
jgi:hypothetical protein